MKKRSSAKYRAVLERLSDVTATEVEYIWPKRLPRGKLTIIAGDPDVGKSFLSLDIAARISAGRRWPDGTRAKIGRVIHLSAEDGLADTIKPRIDAMRGASTRIFCLTAVKTRSENAFFSLTDHLSVLRKAIRKKRARLVIIDPLSAFFGRGVDTYKDAEVRSVLGPVAKLAEEERVAIIAVMHLTKDPARKAIYRALGSVAFVAAPRAVFGLARHPERPSLRVLGPLKFNLGAPPPELAFRIKDGRVKWSKKAVTVRARQILEGAVDLDGLSALDEAKSYLQQFLGDKPMLAGETIRAARSAGIAEQTLRRAKAALGIKAQKTGFGGDGSWKWVLPKRKPKTN